MARIQQDEVCPVIGEHQADERPNQQPQDRECHVALTIDQGHGQPKDHAEIPRHIDQTHHLARRWFPTHQVDRGQDKIPGEGTGRPHQEQTIQESPSTGDPRAGPLATR